MNRTFTAFAIVFVLAAAIFTTARLVADTALITPGSKAPNFTLPSQDGSPVSLNQYHGHWVVLYFYPKDQTPGCTIEAHNFQRDQAKFDALNAVILGVSLDSVESHQKWCTKDNLTFKMLADPDHKVVDLYGVGLMAHGILHMAKRTTFLINPDGNVAKVWVVSDVNHHSDEVQAEIAAESKK